MSRPRWWLFGALFFLSRCLAGMPECQGAPWQEVKGDHFIVYFSQDEKFARDVLYKAEVYYQRIAAALGYSRYSEFWTWDKRVKVYIYPDHRAYCRATNSPDWTHGVARYREKVIASYVWGEGFLEALLPHEMAHLIFRDFVGFRGEVPLWLDEGVAQWSEESKRQQMKAVVKNLLAQGMLMSLKDMIGLDVRSLKPGAAIKAASAADAAGNRRGLSFETEELIPLFYAEAVSLVGFLIERYGADEFTVFCRNLRDGKTLDDALKSAYPVYIHSAAELEMRWVAYINENY